tara:strand:- start:672 stop:1028 length:357 start_codon:yes stop_codon:yes gene_type:complete
MRKIFFFLILILFSCKDYGNPVNLEEITSYTYSENIQPIFNMNCIDCHGQNNQYGDLRLDSYQAVLNSSTIHPFSSTLYERITLPESNELNMPPQGFLTSQEIELINTWINLGSPEEW